MSGEIVSYRIISFSNVGKTNTIKGIYKNLHIHNKWPKEAKTLFFHLSRNSTAESPLRMIYERLNSCAKIKTLTAANSSTSTTTRGRTHF